MMSSFIHYLSIMRTCITYLYRRTCHRYCTCYCSQVRYRVIIHIILPIPDIPLQQTMHHIVPSNEHQDGSVACNASCDRNESFKFAILNVIEEFFSDSIRFLRPDHVLFTDVHTVLLAGRTVACRSQLSES